MDPNPTDEHVGSRVRTRRLMLGMSQAELGAALAVTDQQVQDYESGAEHIGAGRLVCIAEILRVAVTFFFEIDEPTTH
jgi:transcriptional regulator with XRE-family HTH domain